MFYDPRRVGALAVTPADLGAGRPAALFKVLVAAAMFQRRQDVQIMRILRGLPATTAREIGSLGKLTSMAAQSPCQHLKGNSALITRCDLDKDHVTRAGMCGERPDLQCHLKRHTEALKRYGHFGKVPTSIALTIRETGARDLRALYRRVIRASASPADAARRLEEALCGAWRVNQKIACMFLSVAANPALGDRHAPWAEGLEWNRFVVVDSNVDLFLEQVGYDGVGTYNARRAFIQALARRVDLAALRAGLAPYNARLVQQAMYLFMSKSNRRTLAYDCSHQSPSPCLRCPGELRTICPRRA